MTTNPPLGPPDPYLARLLELTRGVPVSECEDCEALEARVARLEGALLMVADTVLPPEIYRDFLRALAPTEEPEP